MDNPWHAFYTRYRGCSQDQDRDLGPAGFVICTIIILKDKILKEFRNICKGYLRTIKTYYQDTKNFKGILPISYHFPIFSFLSFRSLSDHKTIPWVSHTRIPFYFSRSSIPFKSTFSLNFKLHHVSVFEPRQIIFDKCRGYQIIVPACSDSYAFFSRWCAFSIHRNVCWRLVRVFGV